MACLDNPDAAEKAIAKMPQPAKAKGRSFRGFNLFLDPDYRLCAPTSTASRPGARPASSSACAPTD